MAAMSRHSFNIEPYGSMGFESHMPGGERRKHIDIEVRMTKIKVTTSKNRTKI
jgi:hypothetical protein